MHSFDSGSDTSCGAYFCIFSGSNPLKESVIENP